MKSLEQHLEPKQELERLIEHYTVKYTTAVCPFEIYDTKEKLKVLQLVYNARYAKQVQQ